MKKICEECQREVDYTINGLCEDCDEDNPYQKQIKLKSTKKDKCKKARWDDD